VKYEAKLGTAREVEEFSNLSCNLLSTYLDSLRTSSPLLLQYEVVERLAAPPLLQAIEPLLLD
jgi:hypothetical protein